MKIGPGGARSPSGNASWEAQTPKVETVGRFFFFFFFFFKKGRPFLGAV